jgi:hypothetical protein
MNSRRQNQHGYALIITTVFLAVVLTVFASMMYWISSNATVSQRNNQYIMSEAAAEAASERVMAQMMRDYLSQSLTNASFYSTLQFGQTNYDGTSWPVQYVFSDASGVTNQISVLPGTVQQVLQPLGSEYAGLQGYPWLWTNIVTATPLNQPYPVSAKVTEVMNFSSIPIFQYAIFYNLNLEIDPSPPMYVNGPVWSNQGIWAGSGNLTFNSTVSAVGQANTTTTDPFATGKTDGSAPAHFTLSGQPTSGNTALVMPIAGATNSNPTNVEAILNIPPSAYAMGTAAAYTTNGQTFLANEASLIISNSASGLNATTPTGTNIFIYYQDSFNTPALTQLTPDFYRLKIAAVTGLYTNYVSQNTANTNWCYTNVDYAGWSFATNCAFTDFRESKTVQALQINVGLLNTWLNNSNVVNSGYTYNGTCSSHTGHTIDSVWAYNSVPLSTSVLPAVRLINGVQLPNSWGFTVATPMPIYVYGDYNKKTPGGVSSGTNTLYTFPAALMGDSITLLSSNWSDSYTSGSTRTPVYTTLNAACLEGIVQSKTNISGNYSGGVENFMRYLETWTGVTNTYNGSIVVMFPSIYATNSWNGSGYYQPPNRSWGFDFNFLQQAKLPPLTPQLKKAVRWSWASN